MYLVKGAVLLQHDAPHFFDIQLPMVVLTKVTSDIEFVRVEACQLSRLEVRHSIQKKKKKKKKNIDASTHKIFHPSSWLE
jgi:hypothetical protein